MTASAHNPPPAQADWRDDEIDLIDLIQYLWAHKWLLISSGLIGGLIGVAIALTADPVYRAEAVLVAAEEESGRGLSALAGSLGGLAALGGIDVDEGDTKVDQGLTVLKSRVLLERFIKDRNLLPVLFADHWDEDNEDWTPDAADNPPSVRDGYKLFVKEILSSSRDSDTGVITVAVEWTDPRLAAQWANELVRRANETLRAVDIREAENNLAFLREELPKTSVVDVQQSIYSLIEAQIKAIMLANVREGYVFRVIDPAAAPEPDDYVRPRKLLIVILGGMLGGMLGLMFLGVRALARAVRERSQAEQ